MLEIQGGYADLIGKLAKARRQIPKKGKVWAEQAAKDFKGKLQHNLDTQGRGGIGPPLAEATRKIYEQTGQPDGSALRNRIEITVRQLPRGGIKFIVGIPPGQPEIIALVQDRGAVVRVTSEVRSHLAQFGITAPKDFIRVPGRGFFSHAVRESRREQSHKLKKIKLFD